MEDLEIKLVESTSGQSWHWIVLLRGKAQVWGEEKTKFNAHFEAKGAVELLKQKLEGGE